MDKEQIDRFLEIFIDLDNGKYDDEIMAFTELLQLLGIDKNYTINSPQDLDDMDEVIFHTAMKQIEKGDYEYFKTKIKDEQQDEYVYEGLMAYSYDFDTKKNYIKQHYNAENRISGYVVEGLASIEPNIIDLMNAEKDDLDPNKIISEQQDFVKWCVEYAQEIGLDWLVIIDVIQHQQQIIELCIQNEKEIGFNISDIVSEQQKLIAWCLKNYQQRRLDICSLSVLMDGQFNSFIRCIENAKDIILNGGDLRFLIQSYHDFCVELSKSDIDNLVNVNSLKEIIKWYNENKYIEKDDVSHFINEFCKKCIDELDINSNNMLNIIKNNINDPEYVKRTNRRTKATRLNT